MGTEHPLIICQPQVLWGGFQAFPDSFSVWVCTAWSWHGVSSCSSAAWPPLLPIPERWKCPPKGRLVMDTLGSSTVVLVPSHDRPQRSALQGLQRKCKWLAKGRPHEGDIGSEAILLFPALYQGSWLRLLFQGELLFLGWIGFFSHTFPSGPAVLALLFKSTCWKHSGHVCVPLQSVPEDRPGFLSHKSRLVRPSHLGPRKMAPGPSCSLTINVAYK